MVRMCGRPQATDGGAMAESPRDRAYVDLMHAGFDALARGQWDACYRAFRAALEIQETPEAFEGLAQAAWWLDDIPTIFAARERAYSLFRQRGDRRHAASMATWLGLDHYIYRGEVAIANGWLQRAHRLIDAAPPSVEHGWLAIWSAHIALFEENDVVTARRESSRVVTLGRSLQSTDLEFIALALEGLALVSEGEVVAGMHRLDEATTAALAGEMTDPDAIVTTCCYLIFACERVRDYERAAEWCAKAESVSKHWSYRSMFAICRCHYAAVLMWRGDWSRAEHELLDALDILTTRRPGWARDALVRLGELRRRQGRFDEATTLFTRAQGHPSALLGLAQIALDREDAASAVDLIERFLRRVSCENRTERAVGLEVAIRAQIALGQTDLGETFATELDAAADALATQPLQAASFLAHGLLAAADGALDHARRSLEDAVDLYQRCGAPYEAASARLELASILRRVGRISAAQAEATEAHARFVEIGAAHDARRAATLIHDLDGPTAESEESSDDADRLTPREIEVLRLIAQGANNQQIAAHLFISVRTVERHVSTIYAKIGAHGTAARSIATAYALQAGLTLRA